MDHGIVKVEGYFWVSRLRKNNLLLSSSRQVSRVSRIRLGTMGISSHSGRSDERYDFRRSILGESISHISSHFQISLSKRCVYGNKMEIHGSRLALLCYSNITIMIPWIGWSMERYSQSVKKLHSIGKMESYGERIGRVRDRRKSKIKV